METGIGVNTDVLRDVADAFYQERVQDGMAHLEEMITVCLSIFGESEPVFQLLNAIEAGDYVMAADIITYDMIGAIEG